MDQTISAAVPAPLAAVQRTLQDLMSYQHWMDLVDEVEPAPAADGDPGPAFLVTLIAKIGPFARRKRLRMVRTKSNDEGATFERREVDGRNHSSWVLGAEAIVGNPTSVAMRLAYGGGLWSDALKSVLESQVIGAVDGLAAYAVANYADEPGA